MTIKNSILIKNSLKTGQNDLIKTIELLDKLGILKPKRKSAPRKPKMTAEDEIRQSNESMGEGWAQSDKPTTDGTAQNRFPSSRAPNLLITGGDYRTVDQINQAQKAIQNNAFNPQQIEDIKRETNQQLGLLKDQLQKDREYQKAMTNMMGNAIYSLGYGQQKFRGDSEQEKVQPFKEPKVEYVDDDIDESNNEFTNQGSQDIPEDVMNIDVSTPEAGLEDEEAQLEAELSGLAPPIKKEEPKINIVEDIKPKPVTRARAEPKPKAEVKVNKARAVLNYYKIPSGFNKNMTKDDLHGLYLAMVRKGIYTGGNFDYAKIKKDELYSKINNSLINKYDEVEINLENE